MPQYADCYFLTNTRSSEWIIPFLDTFLPNRVIAQVDFVLCDSERNEVFYSDSAEEVINFLEKNPKIAYTIYWNNTDKASIYCHAMLFYTDDGNIIVGISTPGRYIVGEDNPIRVYEDMKKYFGFQTGCITVEEAAPTNTTEFIDFCLARYIPERYH